MKRATSARAGRASTLASIPVPGWIAARLRGRPDSEHELPLYRLAIGGLAGCYLLIASSLEAHGGRDPTPSIAWVLAAYELISLGILCDLLLRSGASAGRRLAGILVDFGALSYCMHVSGEIALPLYPLYLVAIWANGFRFGTRYLLAVADTAVASFALGTVATEFFAAHPALSLGLLGGLIVPALHLRPLMRGLRRSPPHSEAPAPTLGSEPTRIMAAAGDPVEPAVPAPAVDHDSDQQAELTESSPNPEPARRLSILVAEDNAITRTLIAKILEKAGYEPRTVENGQAAAEIAAKESFDAVLMDLDTPVLNGIEAAKLVRFVSTGRSRVPILALATHADEVTQRHWEEAGMDACIAKPIEPAALLRALDAALLLEQPARERQSATATGSGKPGLVPKHRPSPLDLRTLESLKALGGDEFVEELAQQFIDDAVSVLDELSRAVAKGDAQAFREHAHALRSGAANIGARGIYEMCLGWRRIDPVALASKGNAHLQDLEQELGRVRAALQDYRDYRAARKRSGKNAAQAETDAAVRA
jgi:CheY-like chemotaxis protein/HPt (histidine-containing phosphotransfer) domain-containing protein